MDWYPMKVDSEDVIRMTVICEVLYNLFKTVWTKFLFFSHFELVHVRVVNRSNDLWQVAAFWLLLDSKYPRHSLSRRTKPFSEVYHLEFGTLSVHSNKLCRNDREIKILSLVFSPISLTVLEWVDILFEWIRFSN